jgi:hypothetical protein
MLLEAIFVKFEMAARRPNGNELSPRGYEFRLRIQNIGH